MGLLKEGLVLDVLKIVRVRKALGLKREMVGVRFMPYKKEYDLSDATEKRHVALCEVVSDASRGIHGKTRSSILSITMIFSFLF